MSYQAIAQAAQNPALRNRLAACVAQQQQTTAQEHPFTVTDRIMWACAAEPGWGEAWESALAAQAAKPLEDREEIGYSPAVITDAMILAAVQKHLGATT